MHYEAEDFSKGNCKTITSKVSKIHEILSLQKHKIQVLNSYKIIKCFPFLKKINGVDDEDLGSAKELTSLDIDKIFAHYQCDKTGK